MLALGFSPIGIHVTGAFSGLPLFGRVSRVRT